MYVCVCVAEPERPRYEYYLKDTNDFQDQFNFDLRHLCQRIQTKRIDENVILFKFSTFFAQNRFLEKEREMERI